MRSTPTRDDDVNGPRIIENSLSAATTSSIDEGVVSSTWPTGVAWLMVSEDGNMQSGNYIHVHSQMVLSTHSPSQTQAQVTPSTPYVNSPTPPLPPTTD